MIRITIKTDNEAFSDSNKPHEVARILRDMADKLSEFERFQFAHVYDLNGNNVGDVVLTNKDRSLL